MKGFEQYLYLIDNMISSFTYDQAKFFVETCKKNILFGLKGDSPSLQEYQNDFDPKARRINQFHKNVLVY